MWVKEVKVKGMPIIAQFHDEVVGLIKVGHRAKVTKMLKDCIAIVNKKLKLNRELDCSVDFGENYAQIH